MGGAIRAIRDMQYVAPTNQQALAPSGDNTFLLLPMSFNGQIGIPFRVERAVLVHYLETGNSLQNP